MIPQGNIQTYIVENGETLYDVSNKLNTNVDKIIEDNDSIYLLPGQLLIIKSKPTFYMWFFFTLNCLKCIIIMIGGKKHEKNI